ncbi:hypothetical protein PRO82_000698 [Candidatus Protochlamydia amoebophila]|nr:hypothetical protein [Candidatus Protochlamydia amoebophila]
MHVLRMNFKLRTRNVAQATFDYQDYFYGSKRQLIPNEKIKITH